MTKENKMGIPRKRLEEDETVGIEEWFKEGEGGVLEEWPEEYVVEFAQEYNKECNWILKQERKKRGLTQDKLARGILNRVAMRNLEEGKGGWSKSIGDTLMHRMGICTDFFETVTFGEELDRWRDREEICRVIFHKPQYAAAQIEEYRRKYKNQNTLEEQFLLKAEVILMLTGKGGNDKIYEAARKAAACTIPSGWERGVNDLCLAPPELEALLLAGYVWLLQGKIDEAWKQQREIWEYPKMMQWEERVEVLIKPQAALLGIKIALRKNDADGAFEMGREALELLRRYQCQRYLLPLLDVMGDIDLEDAKPAEYLNQAAGFAKTFRKVYEMYDCPGYRLWQSVDMGNTREVGMTLRMLRKFHGKSQANAVVDGEGQIVTQRHLVKIEQGEHKPSTENYRRLITQYGKYGGWGLPLLETDSIEALEVRQRISDLIGFKKWEEAEWEVRRFRRMVDVRYPRIKQELLFWEALLKKHTEADLKGCLKMLFQAFQCTVPNIRGKDMGCWVFQREEVIIASNIAITYRKMGKLPQAKLWFETVLRSLRQQKDRTGIWYVGYDILIGAYDNLLADMGLLQNALHTDGEAVEAFLKFPRIRCMASMFYRIAWNSYEIAQRDPSQQKIYQERWGEAYLLSQSVAEFIYDFPLLRLLEDEVRRDKFLHHLHPIKE